MAYAFPYTYISCPCSDASRRTVKNKQLLRDVDIDEATDEEHAFDPRDPTANFSLFPPEHLLYCEECHDIKCPRCVTEEIICTYCPSCLFEVPSSSIKLDYNRCSRNCFSCPVCTSQLVTTSFGEKADGPWILSCGYCMWSSSDIGIKFDKPQNIRHQIDQRSNGGQPKPSYREPSATVTGLRNFLAKQGDLKMQDSRSTSDGTTDKAVVADSDLSADPHTRFEALKAFYKEQITVSNALAGSGSGLDVYSSPSSLSRIMSIYTNPSGASQKKSNQNTDPMREASTLAEGLLLDDAESLTMIKFKQSYVDAPTAQQLLFQHPRPIGNPQAQHVSELRPMPTLLRTKRSKRCAACKHILVKPEFKVTSTRYRIKLIALNYIPFVSLKPVPVTGGLPPIGPDGVDITLEPGKPSQWIMTFRNPLFENLSVNLGSPNTVPGKHGHRVTILCPEFDIGKNGDVWDDALGANTQSLSSSRAIMSPGGVTGEQTAGKIYDRGRNWTSIVIEIIPVHILKAKDEELEEDEDVIEVPIRVRLEWTATEEEGTETMRKRSEQATDERGEADDRKRELAYWMVLGIGRVAMAS